MNNEELERLIDDLETKLALWETRLSRISIDPDNRIKMVWNNKIDGIIFGLNYALDRLKEARHV